MKADFRGDGDILSSPHGPGAGKLNLKSRLGYPEKCGRARRLLRMLGGLGMGRLRLNASSECAFLRAV
jgi:hypothetical protein